MPALAQRMLIGCEKWLMAWDIEVWMEVSELMSPCRQWRLGFVEARGFGRRSCAVTLQPCAMQALVTVA